MISGRSVAAVVVLVLAAAAIGAGCAESSEASCELNSDCVNAYCRDGACVRDCVDASLDCPKGYTCNAIGQCEFDDGAGGGASMSTGVSGSASTVASGTSGATSTATASSGQTTATSSSSGGGVTKADLSLCNADAECDSGMCRDVWKVPGKKRCTHACASSAQCASGFRCETVGAESYCVPSDIGRSCTIADECFFACLTSNQYCTSTCVDGSDCPSGYGCMPIGNPATRVCIRANADCAADTTQCVVPAACDSSPNLVVSSCTTACDTAADCPVRAAPLAPWTCDGVCRRPGDVYGPLPGGFEPAQWACNASANVVNVCGDGLHLDFDALTIPPAPAVSCASPTTTDGLPGDACVESCRLGAGCPSGFACAGIGNLGGQRAGLCMRSGTFEVGEACADPSDCVFGVCDTTTGRCSRDCSLDDACPEGSTCTPVGGPNIEGASAKRCL